MRSMCLALVALTLGLSAGHVTVADEPAKKSDGFLPADLSGWEGLKEYWTYKQGALTGASPDGLKFNTFLCSKKKYGDFELSFQIRLKGGKGNSGVQIRSHIHDEKVFAVTGPQCDIGDIYWGSLYGEHFGGMMKQAPPDLVKKVLKADDFNDYAIRCVGKKVTIKLNGETTVDGEFPKMPAEGIIAWQLHSGGPMEVTFRKIQFRDLSSRDAKGIARPKQIRVRMPLAYRENIMSLNRRRFLGGSAGLAGMSALAAAKAADKPNERVVLAVMGVRGRGKDLVRGFSAIDGVEIGCICEVDSRVVPAALKAVADRQKQPPRVERDIRRVLQDKSITGVVIAAPDHWHALATVWACQAGKHVYVEKPVSHNLVEGRRMVEAARRHKCVVQVGTQRRSGAHFQSAAELVRSGKLGKTPFARTWIAGNRPSIGRHKDAAAPKEVDYNLWLGPAADRPFNPNRFHYNWHWFWDYGTGELGNNGIHALDVARWVMGLDAPVRISSGGGKYFYDDDQETPDTHVTTFDFPNCAVTWEHRIWSRTGSEGQSWGVIVYGERGTLVFDDRGWRVTDGITASDKAQEFNRAHLRNFLDCIRTGQRPNADIEDGHKSTRLCHLGNIALRLGRTLRFDGKTETCPDDSEANRLLTRSYRKPFAMPG